MSAPARRWLEISVRSASAGDRSPLLADGLVGLGGRAVMERDGWYVTYLEEPERLERFVSDARSELARATGLDDIELRTGWQEHEEWAESWKRGLAPRRVGHRIVVRPSWKEAGSTEPDDVVIVLDPGMAFGTAEHGTTRGCLRLLEGAMRPGERVLDLGSGSGILAVAAAGLGAAQVLAVEGDALACEALAENVRRNGVGDRVRIERAWADAALLESYPPFSGVVANLETGLLVPLFGALVRAVERGGWLIVSGILEGEWPGVERALVDEGCARGPLDVDGEWRSGLFRRPS